MNYMNDVKTKLIQAIDNTKTLSQEDLNQVFAKIRMLLDHGVLMLSSISPYLQNNFVDVAIRVLNGRDANKAFYKRTAALADIPFEKSRKQDFRDAFVSDAMDMMAAMLRNDLPAQQQILVESNLTRSIFEIAIDSVLDESGNYFEAVHAAVMSTGGQRFMYDQTIVRLEEQLGCTKGHLLYGVLRYLKRIREAQRQMYALVLEAYTRIVLLNAKRSAGSIAQESDSFQQGAIGLLRATSLYDHCGYTRFSNFAASWINQHILYSIKDEANTVRVPLNIWQQHSHLEKERVPLEAKFGPLSYEELADKLGLTVRQVSDVYTAIRAAHPESIDAPTAASRNSKRSVGSRAIPSLDSQPAIFDELLDTRVDDIQSLHEIGARAVGPLASLPYREAFVLCLSYGLLEELPEKPDFTDADRAQEVLVERYRQRHPIRKQSTRADTGTAKVRRLQKRQEVTNGKESE